MDPHEERVHQSAVTQFKVFLLVLGDNPKSFTIMERLAEAEAG